MFLGLDIGTSGVKALLIDERGDAVGQAHAELSVSRPHPGWSEQDPDAWIAACESAIDALAKQQPDAMRQLRGIGLSGQMHGATCLGADDKPLRPAILWNDGRSAVECGELEERADFRGIGGNIVMAGFTAPKLRWIEKHEPEVFAKIAKVLLPKDYVRLWLTGGHTSDMSDAAGTLWMDVGARNWSDRLLEATNLSRAQMPDLVEGSESSGTLRAALAERWGVGEVPVAGGGGDNAATACGMGLTKPGTGFLSLGTSGVLFATTDRFAPNTEAAVHAFCHAVPGTWHQMGVILSAVDSLTWLGEITGKTGPELTAMLPNRIEGPSAATFLPYLSGERTPHNAPDATGAFLGLQRGMKLPDLVHGVLDGVAFAFADCATALRDAGTSIDSAFAVGGGAKSDAWLRIAAAATGLTLLKPVSGDFGAAFGAARLGALAAGAEPDVMLTAPAVEAEIAPDAALSDAYAGAYARYRDTWARLSA